MQYRFHPLHLYQVMPIYILLCLPVRTRGLGIGLCIHMVLDTLDCWMMTRFLKKT